MPSPKDLTSNLSRLHRNPLPRTPQKPVEARFPEMRKMAFDPILWLTFALLIGTVVCQLTLLFWKWA